MFCLKIFIIPEIHISASLPDQIGPPGFNITFGSEAGQIHLFIDKV